MNRWRIGLTAVLVVVAMVVGTTMVSASPSNRGKTIRVVERATTDTVIDLGSAGDSLGDLLVFGNNIYNRANTTVVGRDQGSCVRTNPGSSWECTWTTILAKGSITVEGPFYDDLRDSLFAITGGTGRYQNARGQMKLHSRDAVGSELDFVFHVIG